MYFNVSGLLKDRVGATRSYELESEALNLEGETFEFIRGPVSLLKIDRGILAEAEVDGFASVICARCLAPTSIEVHGQVQNEFYPINSFETLPAGSPPEQDADPDDSWFWIDDRNMLDLSEAVRQALSSAIPMATLCKPQCLGLCPQCAVDRNTEACQCEEEEERGPLAQALAGLKYYGIT